MLLLDKLDVDVEYVECLDEWLYASVSGCTLPVGELGALNPAYMAYASLGDCCIEGKNPGELGDLGSG